MASVGGVHGVARALGPCRLVLTTLQQGGARTRAQLWDAVKDAGVIKSKSQLKRVIKQLILRDKINARTDVKKIRDMRPKKFLSQAQRPSWLFKVKGEYV